MDFSIFQIQFLYFDLLKSHVCLNLLNQYFMLKDFIIDAMYQIQKLHQIY